MDNNEKEQAVDNLEPPLYGSPDWPFDEPSRGYVGIDMEDALNKRDIARNIITENRRNIIKLDDTETKTVVNNIADTETKLSSDSQCIHDWLGREYNGSTDKCGDYCPRKNKDNCDHIDADSVDSIVYSVLRKFTQRAKVGKEKYKTDLDRTDLHTLDWIRHTQEEMMDGILYLEKLKKEFEKSSINREFVV